MQNRRPITFDRVIRVLAVLAAIAVAVWLVDTLRNVLLPFCVACLLAYMLEPVVEFHQRKLHLKKRVIPVMLTLLEATLLVCLLAYFFIPSAIHEIEQLDAMVKASSGHRSLGILPPDIEEYLQRYVSYDTLRQYISGSRIEAVLSKSTTLLAATVDFLMHTVEWLLTFIYVIFILLDYRRLMRGFRLVVPPRYRTRTYAVLDDIKNNMDIYFRSQAVIAGCAALFYCIGFSIVGLPLAIVMGILVGILYMIPYFQYITLIPVVILCYLDSLTGSTGFWIELGKCIAVYIISQSICDYLLTPKIMGKTLGLNPAIILLSLSVWGTLLGIIGMIIALPLTALIIAYYKQYVLKS